MRTLSAHVGACKASRASYVRGFLCEEPACRYCFWEQYFVAEFTRREISFRLDLEAELELECYVNAHEGHYPASFDGLWFAMPTFERDFYTRFFHKYWDMQDWNWVCRNISACAVVTMREIDRGYLFGDGSGDEWV